MIIRGVNKDLKKSKTPEKTLYIFDNLNEAIDTVWAIISGIENPDDHIYLIKKLKVRDEMGHGVYELSDGEIEIKFKYSPDGLPDRFKIPENKYIGEEEISIIGSISDIGRYHEDPDTCKMRGAEILAE